MHRFPSPQVGLMWLSHVMASAHWEVASPARACVPPSLQWAAVSVPAWLGAVGPHTVSTPRSARSLGEGPLCGKNCFDETSLCVLSCGRSCWPGALV